MKIYFVILLILPFISFSQIIDNFDDSEIENNPQWYGDIKKYEVIDPPVTGDGSLNAGANDDNYVLRSLQNESDAIIKLENATAYGEWRFSVADGGNWSISSTNDYKIILMSDDSTRANLVLGSHNFNGYYLRFDGSNSDQFVLYRQNGTTSTVVLNTGYPASVDGTTPIGRSVKVIRTQIGEWSIFIDEGFNVNPSTQRGSTVVENSITSSEWFGIATNIDNPGLMRVLYFDNLYIGPVIADTIKPYIQNVEIISSGQLDVFFNETIDTITSQIALNYFINNSIGNPDSAVIDISQHNLVHLYLNNQLVLGTYYILSVENIEDFSGNIIDSANYNFIYYIIQHYDIVINEIMADPNPVQYLPDFEYIELNNTTPYDLELKNWTLTVGTTIKTIPTSTIDAFGYMILCNTTAESSFQTYGSVTGISSFPALTNGGATIIIKNEIDSTISTITYSDTWYQDPLKAAGGWSIEKIDPLNQCGGYTNWIASNNYLGGTPGSLNSVYTSNIDTTAPYAENLYVLNSQQISVEFSEPINSSLISLSDFSV
ncbi:MAG: lamin tail domain-containing protein, partial [Bacteroidota bacterium]